MGRTVDGCLVRLLQLQEETRDEDRCYSTKRKRARRVSILGQTAGNETYARGGEYCYEARAVIVLDPQLLER